jgi:hopanoid biosynthesis associated RND transporter like protein HpnN
MKQLRSDGWVGRALTGLAEAISRRPRWFIYPQLVLFGLSVYYTVTHLQFNTDRSSLVGAEKKYQMIYQEFLKEFPMPKDLVVVVESEKPEKNRQFVERLGAKLEVRTNLFRTVFYRTDLSKLGPKALQFIAKPDLEELHTALTNFRPFLNQFTHATNLVSLFDLINRQFTTTKRERSEETDSLIGALPALERILRQATDAVRRPGVPPSPGVAALFNAGPASERKPYVNFDEGRVYLVTATPHTDKQNAAAIRELRSLIAETQREVPGLNAGLTGERVLEIDEMAQSERDTAVATVLSFVLVFVIIIFGYGRISRRIKADGCLIVGMGYTMAFTTLVVGHLNILTVTFAPILVGIAIDFGVHLIARYEEEMQHGKTVEEAMCIAMVLTGQGILTGALTTAGAFLAMWFTNFKGIQEMGIICGGGLAICLIPMMTLLPALLLSGRRKGDEPVEGGHADRRVRIERMWLNRPRLVMAITVVTCGVAACMFGRIRFDYNLLNMQSDGLPAVEYEETLLEAGVQTDTSPRSLLFGAVMANTPAEARRLELQMTNLSTVAAVESMSRFLTDEQTNKLELIRRITQELDAVKFSPTDPQPVNVADLSRTLYSFYGLLGAALGEVQKKNPDLVPTFNSLREAVEGLRRTMLQGNQRELERTSRTLAAFQQAMFDDLRQTFSVLRNQDTSGPLRAQDLPLALRDRFVGVTGRHLVQVYPKHDVWQRDHQEAFVRQVRSVYPELTGTPVQLYEYTSLLKKSYQDAALYALATISLLVLFHFRSLSALLLALLPVAIGAIWLGGFMGYHDVPFNPANIMTLPLVIGIGVTNGIHILNRFAEEQQPSILGRSTGKAVLVSGLTTCAGFGSLIFAQHRGISTLGSVMTVGVTTCMIAGLIVLPALLTLIGRGHERKKQPSADNARSTLGREEPR